MPIKASVSRPDSCIVPDTDGQTVNTTVISPDATQQSLIGEVVKLDRGFPLVSLEDGRVIRCEQAASLVKARDLRPVIGDMVVVEDPADHDTALIKEILPRRSVFVRKDPAQRSLPQVLAANFDQVFIAEPVKRLNLKRLERELVLAHETGMPVTVILTKADLVKDSEAAALVRAVCDLTGDNRVLVVSDKDDESIEAVRCLISKNQTAILIGQSGVGKSSLVNRLAGRAVLETGDVRAKDGKGRHTTVSRQIVSIPGGGRIVDMPGIRGLGLWDAGEGIDVTFPDIVELAAQCRFRDCRHKGEPGCAVQSAVKRGELSASRLASYHQLADELQTMEKRREEARWIQSEGRTKRRRA